jgi:hypothetical protein
VGKYAMILHLQCVPLPAISATYDPDSARTPFIPLNPIPGHDYRIALALFAGQRVGRRLGKQNRHLRWLRAAFRRLIRTKRGLILWMSSSDEPDDHPRTGRDGEDSPIGADEC